MHAPISVRPRPRAVSRPKLALFAPLPPKENGIADYVAELLPLHAATFAVTVVIEDGHPPPDLAALAGRVEVRFLSEYQADPGAFRDHLHLYHLGNNPDHVYLLDTLLRVPGVVVLHDGSLHHLMDCATLQRGRADAYAAVLEREHGPPGALLAGQLARHGWRERAMFYELPLTRTLLGRAKAVVTHSAYAWTKAKAAAPATRVVQIPHHLSPATLAYDGLTRKAARHALGLPEDRLVLVSLGFVTAAKQVDAVLRALTRLAGRLPPFLYILAGAEDRGSLDVGADVARLGLGGLVRVTGFLSEQDFFRHIAAADLVINLRYPTGGETSGTLIRAMGAGACVVVIDHGPFAELPAGTCIKVPWSHRFEADLEQAIARAAADPAMREAIGARARADVRERHAVARSAAAYHRLLLDSAAQEPGPWGVERPHELLPIGALERFLATAAERLGPPPAGALWVREGLVPTASGGGASLVLLSDRPQLHAPWLAQLGHGDDRVLRAPWPLPVTVRSGFAPPRRDCAVALLATAWTGGGALAAALATLNHRLAFGGLLTVDLLPRAIAGDVPPAEPEEIAGRIAAAGFRVLRSAVGGPSDVSPTLLQDGRPQEGDGQRWEVCWLAVKVSEHLADPAASAPRAAKGER